MMENWAGTGTMAMAVVGGLGIFMLGMKYMSEGMQAVAGNSLRRMISLVTNNRFLAVGAGTGVTVLVQSSTITTVIVVGLVNAGLMQLHQSIGVIMGANIGTTITGWILILKIGAYGLPILGVAALVYLFSRREKPRFIAMAVMGLGMIFFGLELMKNGFAPMKDIPAFMDAFQWFTADTYMGVLRCVLVGCVLTFLVQSSSATLGITIGLAATGVIPFTTAAALVLGENIGTTITVFIASIGANVNAKRTALAHILFNVFGVFWITLIFQWYVRAIAGLLQGMHGVDLMTDTFAQALDPIQFGAIITAGIAMTHTGFNVANTLFFLPWVRVYARFLERVIPDARVKEVSRLKHLDARGVSAPVLGVEQSRGEVIQMGESAVKMAEWIRQLGYNGPQDERLIQKTFHREEVLDNMHEEIVSFLTEVLDATVPFSVAQDGQRQLRIAHEYEAIGDRMASILKSFLRLKEETLELPADQLQELQGLHDLVADFLTKVTHAYTHRKSMDDASARTLNDGIHREVRRLQDEHLQRMTDGPVNPKMTLILNAILTDYRRIRAHALNIHEATQEARVPVGA
jgi:phosphate:Na+ symporter